MPVISSVSEIGWVRKPLTCIILGTTLSADLEELRSCRLSALPKQQCRKEWEGDADLLGHMLWSWVKSVRIEIVSLRTVVRIESDVERFANENGED